MNQLTATEKNAHYAELNARFDNRAAILRSFGFKYEHLTAYNMAVFLKDSPSRKPVVLPAAFVMNADPIVWADRLNDIQA